MSYYKINVDIEEQSTGADSRFEIAILFRGTKYTTWMAERYAATQIASRVICTPHILYDDDFRELHGLNKEDK